MVIWILRPRHTDSDQVLRLPPGVVKTVGRGPRADFVFDVTLLSRMHCQLSAAANQLVVEDLKSTNGTYVNDKRVECVALKAGDCLRLGRIEFVVSRE